MPTFHPHRFLLSLAFCTVLLAAGIASADTTAVVTEPDVLITEIMPDKTGADKSDEFIELYNNSNKVLAANSLQLQLYSSTATSWVDKPYRSITLSQDFYQVSII
jgi:hypothetical protein